MRVLGVLVAWGVLAVLATMCFAVGGSIGYRRGVRDTLSQVRDRRTGRTGCRPLPANHLRRRTSGHARPGARARRARWHVGPGAARRPSARHEPGRFGRVPTSVAAGVAALLLVGIPGTAIGATTAQPGDSLWKVKLGLEEVRLALATTPERDAEVHVDLASVRLTELEGLVDDDPAPTVVGDVAQDLGDHARAARRRLTDVRTDSVRAQLHRRLIDVTAEQVAVMDELLESDCTPDHDLDCDALAATRVSMVKLQDESAGDALVLNESAPVVATPAPSSPPSVVQAEPAPPGVDDQDAEPASAAASDAASPSAPTASAAATAAASAAPSANPSPTAPAPSAAPSAKPSPTTSTAPPTSGSPATEASVAPSPVDGGAGPADGGSAGGAATAVDAGVVE